MQSDPHRNGNECLPYGTVCDGVHAMRKEIWLIAMAVVCGLTIMISGLTVGYTIGELLWTAQELPEVAQTLRCLGVQNPKCLA
jgi:F0F1-type ATP synthase membrane subunit c/vacuolar-type H+-ATPase subunit K